MKRMSVQISILAYVKFQIASMIGDGRVLRQMFTSTCDEGSVRGNIVPKSFTHPQITGTFTNMPNVFLLVFFGLSITLQYINSVSLTKSQTMTTDNLKQDKTNRLLSRPVFSDFDF